tara:strand:+ start:328 stop:636 length:309 start_codon:yes stop_codon:yes gene_type:complete
MISFRLKACVKCQGDLVLDDGDWLCLQCGTYYYTGLYRPAALPSWPPGQPDLQNEETKAATRVAIRPLAGRGASSAVPDSLRPAPASGIRQTAASDFLAMQT